MATREVRTTRDQVACGVCGRTLLRGERAQVYFAGGQRRTVCELCTTRALQEGWVREGAGELGAPMELREPKRPLRERLRTTRRERPAGENGAGPEHEQDAPESEQPQRAGSEPEQAPRRVQPSESSRRRPERPAPPRESAAAGREPRHVHAVPSSHEQRVSAALERFNASEHPRTVAGVARSLGAPVVAARPVDQSGVATVRITVSWELCWYRYEVDLGDEGAGVQKVAQGYEPEELEPEDREALASADERGRLELPGE